MTLTPSYSLSAKNQEKTSSPASVLAPGPAGADDDVAWASMLELPEAVKDLMSVMVLPREANRDDGEVTLQEGNILGYIGGYMCKKNEGKGL